jgi:transmembrane sensor
MTGPRTSPTAPDWDAIARYLAGESSASEAEAVRRWLDAHPSDAKAIAALDAAVGTHAPRPMVDVEAALRKVKTRAARHTPSWALGIAGLAAAAAIIAVLVFPRSTSDRNTQVAESRFSTAQGVRDTVTLGDGTVITLGPSTQLVVSGNDVSLVGEAFFTMSERTTGPYSVLANGATIRDIGTAFGVRAYPDEPLRVVVSSGIVEVSRSGATVVLDSGDVGVMTPGGSVARTADAVTADDVAWMQGRLVFRNATMHELRADLLRWYGVELRVTDTALQRRHFTGSFSNEPVARVADVIALALGARADRQGDTIFIRAARR